MKANHPWLQKIARLGNATMQNEKRSVGDLFDVLGESITEVGNDDAWRMAA